MYIDWLMLQAAWFACCSVIQISQSTLATPTAEAAHPFFQSLTSQPNAQQAGDHQPDWCHLNGSQSPLDSSADIHRCTDESCAAHRPAGCGQSATDTPDLHMAWCSPSSNAKSKVVDDSCKQRPSRAESSSPSGAKTHEAGVVTVQCNNSSSVMAEL